MSLFSKFKNNLQKTSNFLSSNILSSFQNKKVDTETLEELETVLISADISLDVVEKLINSVRKVKTSEQDITKTVLETLSKEIEIILQPREGGLLEEKNTNKILIIGYLFSSNGPKENETTKHLKGATGVYVIAVDKVVKAPVLNSFKVKKEEINRTSIMQLVRNPMTYNQNRKPSEENYIINGLYEKANVIDNRKLLNLGIRN